MTSATMQSDHYTIVLLVQFNNSSSIVKSNVQNFHSATFDMLRLYDIPVEVQIFPKNLKYTEDFINDYLLLLCFLLSANVS